MTLTSPSNLRIMKQPGLISLVAFNKEIKKIAESAASSPDKEIGGLLFGFYTQGSIPVIMHASLASENSLRTPTNFQETVQHLEGSARLIYESYRFGVIERWHSHHHIGLTTPSGGDQRTGNEFARKNDIETFVEIIINLEGSKESPTVRIHPYAYQNKKTVGMVFETIEGDSPINAALEDTILCQNVIRPRISLPSENIFWPEHPKPVTPPPGSLIESINSIPEQIRQKLEVSYDSEITTVTLPVSLDQRAVISFAYTNDDYVLLEASIRDTDNTTFNATDFLAGLGTEPLSNLFLIMLHHALINQEPPQLQLTNGGFNDE